VKERSSAEKIMTFNRCGGWALVLGAIVLLISLGEVDLLAIVLPLSLLLAFGIGCSGNEKNQADGRHQKGVA
jgi:hypothetical protein